MSKSSYTEYLEKVLAATGGNVYWLDESCVYRGCNDNVAKTLGLHSRKDIVGLTDYDLLRYGNWSEEQAMSFFADDQEVIKTKQPKINIQEPIVYDENNNPLYFLTTRIPIFDDEGNVIGVVGTSTDITSLKKAEQALLIAKQELELAYNAKTDFLANMSHDVKTPLSGIIAISELLASRAANSDDVKMIEDMQRCAKKLMSFFENCIELSKMDMAELKNVEKTFSIKKITDAIYELFVPTATAKRLLFSVHLDPYLPAALIGNETNLYRIMLNLVGNAMKFTNQGAVDVSVKLHDRKEHDDIIVKIMIKDTGIGIPKDKQQVIFEKLQRLTPSYYNKQEGHGIGLYIVDQYVKAMQGTIQVDSDVGKGSVFTVTIPLKIAKAGEKNIVESPRLTPKEVPSAAVVRPILPRKSEAAISRSEGKYAVLLVEDNPMIQAVTREMIRSTGAAVDIANDGEEALSLFKPEKYALIYMDLGLPDIDGYEVTRRCRALEAAQHKPQTPILALSAHVSDDIRILCSDAGMHGMLSKPLSFQQARDLMAYYVEKKPVDVQGLQQIQVEGEIIDFPGCVALLGSESQAREILAMTVNLLDTLFLPDIAKAYDAFNDEELRKVIHKFLGSVCYISAPALKQATLDFQHAIKERSITRPRAYQHFLSQVEKFKRAYVAQFTDQI